MLAKEFPWESQITQAAAKTVYCSLQNGGKALLLKATLIELIELSRVVELVFTWSLHLLRLASLVQEGTMNAAKEET